MMWQNIDPVGFIVDFADRIYHVDCKDTRMRPHNGRAGVLGSQSAVGRPSARLGLRLDGARGCAVGGLVLRALDAIGYSGPISIEWEDAGMDRLHGAPRRWRTCARCCGRSPKPRSTPRSATSDHPDRSPMPIQHTVVFRLIHPAGSAEEQEFLATGHAVLTSIPASGTSRSAVRSARRATSRISSRWCSRIRAFTTPTTPIPRTGRSSRSGGCRRSPSSRSTTSWSDGQSL